MRRLFLVPALTAVLLVWPAASASAQTTVTPRVNCTTFGPGIAALGVTITPVPAVRYGISADSTARGHLITVGLEGGVDISDATVGFPLPLGTVTITVFEDPNGNLAQDPGEATIGTAQLVGVCEPKRTSECRNGGWRSFGFLGFKNQGDCVSYVATGGRRAPSGQPR
jgi:hypothetical protein